MKIEQGDALVVVDVQRDFCPGGSLAVGGGDRVVPVLRRYIQLFEKRGLPIVYTRDWHPPDHCSFQSRGGSWPSHCVAGTPGAGFHPDLPIAPGALIISKADTRDREAYSGFEGTRLADELKARGVRRIFVGGLATDYCVRATVLDGLRSGLEAALLDDAVEAVDPDGGVKARREMVEAGATPVRFEEIDPSR